MFGYATKETIGKTIPAKHDLLANQEELLEMSFGGKVVLGFETSGQRSDGSQIPVKVFTSPVYDEERKCSGIVAVIEDISERKNIEKALKEKNNRFVYRHPRTQRISGDRRLEFRQQESSVVRTARDAERIRFSGGCARWSGASRSCS